MWFKKIRYLLFIYLSIGLSRVLGLGMPPVSSVIALIEKDGQLLYLDLAYYSGLGLPGGIIEAGEDVETALAREIKEETGLTILSSQFIGAVHASYRGVPCLSMVYTAATEGDLSASEEGALGWMKPEELVEKLEYPTARLALTRFVLHSKI